MGRALVTVSTELFKELGGPDEWPLPEGTTAERAPDHDRHGCFLAWWLEHKDIPSEAHQVVPVFRSTYDGQGNVVGYEFVGWHT